MKILALAVAAVVSYVAAWVSLVPLRRAGLIGCDVHKAGRPEIPEMGGLACVAGFGAGLLLSLALIRFAHWESGVDPALLPTVLATVLIAAIIGMVMISSL